MYFYMATTIIVRTTATIGIVWLLVLLQLGKSELLDLAKEAEKHLHRLPAEGLISWGWTKDYNYWTDKKNCCGEYPIEAHMENLRCVRITKVIPELSDLERKDCDKFLVFNITDGVKVPFELKVNVTVPLIGTWHHSWDEVLNFTNTSVLWVSMQGTSLPVIKYEEYAKHLIESCDFSANVSLTGSLAYEFERARGDTPRRNALGVGALNDGRIGRLRGRGKTLNFTVSGVYTQNTFCRK